MNLLPTLWLLAGTLLGLGLLHSVSAQDECGDGFLDMGETCDDNNTLSSDGCSVSCQEEVGFNCTGTPSVCSSTCGDGILASNEICDDNNTLSGDGCSALCQVEVGYVCTGSPSTCQVECGNGIRFGDEECDDGMDPSTDGDGCFNCLIEASFICTEDTSSLSTCVAVLLDLNVPDNTTLNYVSEYFDLDEVVFLSDPNGTNMSSFFVSRFGGNWTAIYMVALNGVDRISLQLDLFELQAQEIGRVPVANPAYFSRSGLFQNDPRLSGFSINTSDVLTGMQITGDENHPLGDGDQTLSAGEIDIALRSIGYIAREHPGYGPREFCLIAEDSRYHTLACAVLYFIGRNDDRPVITYNSTSIVAFVEGDVRFVNIINGRLTVTDMDHPTRYPMQSAQASIVDFNSVDPEELSVTIDLPGFSSQYDQASGVLTINGTGTTEVYSSILSNISYHNGMIEPLGNSRTIRITVSDGVVSSEGLDVLVAIVNVNDEPAISLNGGDPVITNLSVTYTEGSGEVGLTPRLVVMDTDPNAMIQRVIITLTNPLDPEFEFLNLTANLTDTGLSLSLSQYRLELSGVASVQDYTNVLRTWTYLHSDAFPGNPTISSTRSIDFFVQDDQGAGSLANSTVYISVVPVNDAPFLFLVEDPAVRNGPLITTGQTTADFSYLEDDPPVIVGPDIYLRDVDSDISYVRMELTGLLNGPQDRIYISSLLYGITANETDTVEGNRTITLRGIASPSQYEEVLQTLTYVNLHVNNTVADGRRSITIVTGDVMGLESGRVYIFVDVMDRNDGPLVDLGGGVNMDYMITFTEEGGSIPITQRFLTSVMDEEGHNISHLTVQLVSPNGNLDTSDAIFFRTPAALQFLSNIDSPLTTKHISISLNASTATYLAALNSIYYDNSGLEPTRYNSSEPDSALLIRVILVTITDANFIDPNTNAVNATDADLGVSTTTVRIGVEITPINDNRPQILINTDPPSCSSDSSDMTELAASMSRRRRDVRSLARLRKKSVVLGSVNELEYSMAPRLVSVCPSFSDSSQLSRKCLKQLVLTFDTDTNTPVVEVPSKLDRLVSFDPPELNAASKFGLWFDYKTLVVHFVDCVEVEVETSSGKPRPMFVAFEAERDSCDWTSPCGQGICFSNETGCPVVSYTRISHNSSSCHVTKTDESQPTEKPEGFLKSRFGVIVVMLVISCLIIVSLISCNYSTFAKRRQAFAHLSKPAVANEKTTSEKDRIEDLIQVTIDIQDPGKEVTPLSSVSAPASSPNDTTACPLAKEAPHLLSPMQHPTSAATLKPSSKKKTHKGKKGVLPNTKRKPPFGNGRSKQTNAGARASSEGAVENVPLENQKLPVSPQCEQSRDQRSSVVSHSNRASMANSREHSIDNGQEGTPFHTQYRQPLLPQGSLS